MPQEDIDKAVNTASENIEGEETKGEETKPEPKKEPEVDARTVEALQLMDMLENPKTAPAVVESLMKQLGIQLPETKKEEAKAAKTVKSILKEKLGADFEFLADKLGDALEEAFTVETGKVRAEVLSVEQNRAQRELVTEYNVFLTENKVSESEAGELNKLVDEIPPTGNIPLSRYLGRLLRMHRAEVAEAKAETAKKQRQKENLQRRPEAAGIEGNEERIVRGSRNISAREAVEAAVRGESLD